MDLNQVEKLKTKLFRMHFLLTEPETDEIIKDGFKQFKMCFIDVLAFLSDYMTEELKVESSSNLELLDNAFKNKLFTEQMTFSLKEMEVDYKMLPSGKNKSEIYSKIKSTYAQHLQLIYDMLVLMGQDGEDE